MNATCIGFLHKNLFSCKIGNNYITNNIQHKYELFFNFRKYIKTYDPFEQSKQNAFTNSLTSIEILCSYVIDVIHNKKKLSIMETKEEFMKFIKFDLWGNQYVLFSLYFLIFIFYMILT